MGRFYCGGFSVLVLVLALALSCFRAIYLIKRFSISSRYFQLISVLSFLFYQLKLNSAWNRWWDRDVSSLNLISFCDGRRISNNESDTFTLCRFILCLFVRTSVRQSPSNSTHSLTLNISTPDANVETSNKRSIIETIVCQTIPPK